MKPRRKLMLTALVGLLLALFVVAVAQTTTQQAEKKQTESCCAMDSCCCHGGSCDMKQGEANQTAKEGCCCCNGDSCDKNMKHDANHAAKENCCGDSCNSKMKHDAKAHTANHASCCSPSAGQNAAQQDMKKHDGAQSCCCCGDSCNKTVKDAAVPTSGV